MTYFISKPRAMQAGEQAVREGQAFSYIVRQRNGLHADRSGMCGFQTVLFDSGKRHVATLPHRDGVSEWNSRYPRKEWD